MRAGIAFSAIAFSVLAEPEAKRLQEPSTIRSPQASFGGAYAGLDARRQRLVDDWVRRFNEVTGQNMESGPFYDAFVPFSTKTTFDAVTNALMTTPLTDASGERFGDALDLIERVEAVKGEISGASGDHQFRMYAGLKESALELLERSQEFKRGADNTVYHRGYPTSYRQQGGTPSIQFSISRDGSRADIDVDYRSSGFPVALFNGHLTSSNSDVRAGNNYDRHTGRWAGFQNWWRSFFGVRLDRAPADAVEDPALQIPREPRAGKKNIDVMTRDFLTAWLIEGDVIAAMGYVSQRSYACLAAEGDDPLSFDLGMAPFQLLVRLKAAHDALGKRESIEGLTVGVNLALRGLKLVDQPHHAQFVLYSVPDDIAAAFDCQSRVTLGDPEDAEREYGNYFGATFYIDTPDGKDRSMTLLWGEEEGYWKIVSWRSDAIVDDAPELSAPPDVQVERIEADPTLVNAAKDFLESWLVRKDYDAAFRYMSPKSYACYNLVLDPGEEKAASLEDAGRKLRESLERSGTRIGELSSLDALLAATEPFHPSVRVMDHADSRTFALASLPDGLAAAVDCSARARGERISEDVPVVYGNSFEMDVRFKTRGGDAPVLRTLWQKENGAWRISVYDVEVP